MAKTLKKFSGRGRGEYSHGNLYVGAYSKKHCAELINEALGIGHITPSEISNYYHKRWGNRMDGIELTEPCVYGTKTWSSKEVPKRLL